jgi:hypothetical protein
MSHHFRTFGYCTSARSSFCKGSLEETGWDTKQPWVGHFGDYLFIGEFGSCLEEIYLAESSQPWRDISIIQWLH